jgi:hypothetical protein
MDDQRSIDEILSNARSDVRNAQNTLDVSAIPTTTEIHDAP